MSNPPPLSAETSAPFIYPQATANAVVNRFPMQISGRNANRPIYEEIIMKLLLGLSNAQCFKTIACVMKMGEL